MRSVQLLVLLFYSLLAGLPSAFAVDTAQSPSVATQECLKCHEVELQQHYGAAQDPIHWRAGVGCYECHQALPDQSDAFDHYDVTLAIDHELNCKRCHKK